MVERLYLDANVLISIVESPGQLNAAQVGLVADIEGGQVAPVTSDLTLAECLVGPMARDDRTGIAAFLGMFDAGHSSLLRSTGPF